MTDSALDRGARPRRSGARVGAGADPRGGAVGAIAGGSGAAAGTRSWANSGWRGIGGVALARLGAQVLGTVWFVVAARSIEATEFAHIAAGLTLVFVFGALGDAGVVRSVSVDVSAQPWALARRFLAGVRLRSAVGASVGAVGVVLVAAAAPQLPVRIVALAGLTALLSGVAETGFAALRAAVRVGTEATMLVVERSLFLAAGLVALAHGGGAVAVMAIYAATNAVTAAVVCGAVAIVARGRRWESHAMRSHRMVSASLGQGDPRQGDPRRGDPRRGDSNAVPRPQRWIAAGSTLTVLAPRVVPLVVILVGATRAAGGVAIAQKPAEALAAFAASIAAPTLPLLAERAARPDGRGAGRGPSPVRGAVRRVDGVAGEALRRAVDFATVAQVLLGAAIGWLLVYASVVMPLVFGAAVRGSSTAAVAFLVAALATSSRTVVESVRLVTNQQRIVAVAVAAGVAVTAVGAAVVMGVEARPDLVHLGIASLLGELTVASILLRGARRSVQVATLGLAFQGIGWSAVSAAAGAITGATVAAFDVAAPGQAAVAAAVVGLLTAHRIRSIVRPDGPPCPALGSKPGAASRRPVDQGRAQTTPMFAQSSTGTSPAIRFNPSSTSDDQPTIWRLESGFTK